MSIPQYSPEGKILLGNVPWDNAYKHVRLYSSLSEQYNDISSLMFTSTEKYTYISRGAAIKVPIPADRLYHVNYCMYRNESITDGYIYCFVKDVEYINDNTTQLTLETDIFQTYLMGTDWEVPSCFVERECVADDTVGKHLNAEPPMDIEYKTYQIADYYNQGRFVVFMVNAFPQYNLDLDYAYTSQAVWGDVYHNQYSACKMIVYDTQDEASMNALERDLIWFNKCGAGEAICDGFMCSTYTLPVADDGGYLQLEPLRVPYYNSNSESDIRIVPGTYTVKANQEAPVHNIQINRAHDFDGYVPKNNKLFVYPYCYAEVGDYTGRMHDFKFEFINNDADREAGILHLKHCEPISGEMSAYVWSPEYNGNVDDRSPIFFTADMSNKISWVYSAYQNWAAQNAATNAMALIGSSAGVAFSVMPGMAAAVGSLGMPIKAEAAAAGGMGLMSTVSKIDQMMKVPNTAKGNVGGNCKYQMRKAGFYTRSVQILREFAEILDKFFTMYGYQVDMVKKPECWSRPNWNYVKTNGCCAKSVILNDPPIRGRGTPADVLAAIRACFDNGITFWHTTTGFGNYELDNSLEGGN